MKVRDHDATGSLQWELSFPARGIHAEYVALMTKNGILRLFIRNNSDDLPFVQLYPRFSVEADWPEPETYERDVVNGTVRYDGDRIVVDDAAPRDRNYVLRFPAPHGFSYELTAGETPVTKVMLRQPDEADPFVCLYPDVRTTDEWPDPPERVDIRDNDISIQT